MEKERTVMMSFDLNKQRIKVENNPRFTLYHKIVFFILLICIFMLGSGCRKQNTEEISERKVTGVQDLAGASIGVQIGTTGDIYASDYEGDSAGTKITRYNKGTDAIQALKQSKIDCVIIDEQPAKAFIKKKTFIFMFPKGQLQRMDLAQVLPWLLLWPRP